MKMQVMIQEVGGRGVCVPNTFPGDDNDAGPGGIRLSLSSFKAQERELGCQKVLFIDLIFRERPDAGATLAKMNPIRSCSGG